MNFIFSLSLRLVIHFFFSNLIMICFGCFTLILPNICWVSWIWVFYSFINLKNLSSDSLEGFQHYMPPCLCLSWYTHNTDCFFFSSHKLCWSYFLSWVLLVAEFSVVNMPVLVFAGIYLMVIPFRIHILTVFVFSLYVSFLISHFSFFVSTYLSSLCWVQGPFY